ncbi:hypothetical protein T484DRAFT_1635739, partial [Baffinella frigidus]
METRVIAHIDMDCFYCEVERQRDPSLRGIPMGVTQYDPFDPKSNGSLIAVSYEARAAGVTRQMRGKEAREKCPDLVLVQVPASHSKSDINLYREAG